MLKEKKLTILVVEDNLEFQECAKKALGENCELRFASKFVEAKTEILKNGKELDGIICDLFFPYSDDDLSGKDGQRIIKFVDEARASKEAEEHWQYRELPNNLADAGEKLAPLGLKLIDLAEGIPMVIFSQGDRHEGALGLVRFAMDSRNIPYLDIFVRGGGDCNKSNPAQWQEALKGLELKNQLRLWRGMLRESLYYVKATKPIPWA